MGSVVINKAASGGSRPRTRWRRTDAAGHTCGRHIIKGWRYRWEDLASDDGQLTTIFVNPHVPGVHVKTIATPSDSIQDRVVEQSMSNDFDRILRNVPDLQTHYTPLSNVRRRQLRQLAQLYMRLGCACSSVYLDRTDRYGAPQVCVKARRPIDRGERIIALVGVTAPMPSPMVAALEETNLNFSLVQGFRRGAVSLLLGPLRFVNHACRPNCRMLYLGSNTVLAKAMKQIAEDEEVTFSYGEDCFGIGNQDCLCPRCVL